MKSEKKVLVSTIIGYALLPFAALADDIGVGRDNDIPDAQPPAETELATTENLLQQVLEWLKLEME